MADITITPGNVVPSLKANIIPVIFGATVAAGELVFLDASDNNRAKLADGNSGTAAVRAVVGMAVNGGAAGQPGSVVLEDPDLAIGAHGVTIGEPLFLSNTPGKVMPYADIAAGNYTAHVAQAKTATTVSFKVNAPLVVHG